jgi:predicted molibdopterin-dependent oxidoreductase YjgC
MEKKIINLIKANNEHQCLLCCEREATIKVEINRVKYNDNVIGFDVCDQCLSKMQGDIQRICE